MWKIWANELLPKSLKSCPKFNKLPNLVTLQVVYFSGCLCQVLIAFSQDELSQGGRRVHLNDGDEHELGQLRNGDNLPDPVPPRSGQENCEDQHVGQLQQPRGKLSHHGNCRFGIAMIDDFLAEKSSCHLP